MPLAFMNLMKEYAAPPVGAATKGTRLAFHLVNVRTLLREKVKKVQLARTARARTYLVRL
jgi:hypothetical protein